MRRDLRDHDLVALLEDTPVNHFQSGEPIVLRRGQMGTVVMCHPDEAFEVEFADREGRAYALVAIPREKLMLLRDTPDHAVAS